VRPIPYSAISGLLAEAVALCQSGHYLTPMQYVCIDGGADLDRALGLAPAKSAKISNPMLQYSGKDLNPLRLEDTTENVSSMLSSSDGLIACESESESEPDESEPKPKQPKGPDY
jgi:hypothetical protein